MMELPSVSIIIPNLNNQDRLKRCLDALKRQHYPKKYFEIIIIDNGSIDKSVEIARKFDVKIIIKPERKSPYWCRNAGIDMAKGEIIALLDSNCIPEHTWLKSGVQALQEKAVEIVAGPIHFQFSDKFSVAERIDFLYSTISAADIDSLQALPATHLFIKKFVFEEVGLFIPHIRSLGDIEWTNRAYKSGFRFGFADYAIVKYPAKRPGAFVKKMIRLGGGRKELWIIEGNSVFSINWTWRIIRQFLPPSPVFYKEISSLNRRENMNLNSIQIFIGLWLLKVFRALGMLFKRVQND